MKDKIISVLQGITGLTDIKLDVPEKPEFGDYTTSVAMKIKGKSPRDNAEKIVKEINNSELISDKYVEKVEIAGPGFINFYLSKRVYFDILRDINSQKDAFGKGESKKGKKIVVEFTDPNPFKEFHVGHLYSNTVGESISRLLESQGATVWRADYFGDVGMHVAKAIWGLFKKFSSDNLSMDDLSGRTLNERIEYLGKAYALGATEYEEGVEDSKEEMKALNFLIFKAAQEVVLPTFNEAPQVNYDQYIKKSKFDYSEVKRIYEVGRQWSMEYFESIYKRLGMHFDGYYPESRTGEYGYGMVMDGLKKGIFEKGEGGAIIFPGEKHGLHNRVFINSLNLPTYETKDFGNSVAKHKDFDYDESLIVTGNEINDYFVVVLKALFMYKPELSEATKHIGHGMVRMPDGKMSSRTGKIVRGEWVLDEAKAKVGKIVEKSSALKEVGKKKRDEISEMLAQGAIKYAFLKQGIGNNIAFDFDSSLSFEGNSGPYLQYTYARTQSVLAKSELKGPTLKLGDELSLEAEEVEILKSLMHFPETLEEAANTYSPNMVCTYLYELAQKFNTFYNKHSILSSGSEDVVNFRLNLTGAVGRVLKSGLRILGIEAPDRM